MGLYIDKLNDGYFMCFTQKLAQMEVTKVICFGKLTICLLHGGIFLDTTFRVQSTKKTSFKLKYTSIEKLARAMNL